MKFGDVVNEDLAGCLNARDALGIFNSSLTAAGSMEDYFLGIREMNRNMPENCPESFRIYFADYGETDDLNIKDEDIRSAKKEYEGL